MYFSTEIQNFLIFFTQSHDVRLCIFCVFTRPNVSLLIVLKWWATITCHLFNIFQIPQNIHIMEAFTSTMCQTRNCFKSQTELAVHIWQTYVLTKSHETQTDIMILYITLFSILHVCQSFNCLFFSLVHSCEWFCVHLFRGEDTHYLWF